MFVLALSAFLIITITIAYSSSTPEKFDVKFEIDDSEILSKTLYITIQNLQEINDDLNFKTIIDSTDFNISEIKNVRLYKQKLIESEIPEYSIICNPYIKSSKEINTSFIYFENCSKIVTDYRVIQKPEWIEIGLVNTEKLSKELSHHWANIAIQNNGYEKDTVKLKLEFDHPIVKRENGWGSQGIIRLDLDDKIYVDMSESSWWNLSVEYRRLDTIKYVGGKKLYNFPYMINGSNGFDLGKGNGTNYVWGLTREINGTNYLYYNKYDEYYLINGSDNEDLPIEIEKGNDTSHNPENIWDNNFTAVYHAHILTNGDSTNHDNDINYTSEVSIISSTNCKFGDCWNFTGTTARMTVNDSEDFSTQELTVEAWINGTSFNGNPRIADNSYNINHGFIFYVTTSSGLLTFDLRGSGGEKRIQSTYALNTNQWYHVAVVFNESDDSLKMYINGQLNKEEVTTNDLGDGVEDLHIGCRPHWSDAGWQGIIDELRISNVARSSDWINATYQFTSSLGQEIFLGEKPTITLVSPEDNHLNITGNITFNCSAIDNNNLVNISLYHNISGTWELNQTNSVGGTSNSTIFTINNIPDETNFVWNCKAYNNASLSDFAPANRTINVNKEAIVFDIGDYILYSKVHDRYKFYIDNSVIFCINATNSSNRDC